VILLIYTLVFAFAFGAAIGSFLNVVIYRVPAGLSVVHPPSRCPTCETQIRWYDNIPIFSWLFLRGKCRDCKTSISPRYALIEALTGTLAAVVWWQMATPVFADFADPTEIPWIWVLLPFLLRFTFLALLIVIAFVDLDHFIIPHQFTIPGMILGLASPWLYEYLLAPNWVLMRWMWPPVTPLVSIIGFVLGGVIIILIFYLYLAARGVEGMGGGDVTLMAMVGAWLGWPSLVFVFFAASLQALIAAGIAHALGLDFLKDGAEVFADDEPLGFRDTAPESSGEASVEPSNSQDSESTELASDNVAEADISNDSDTIPAGKLALPFGPFIALAAAEFLLFGTYMPDALSLIYLYY
jgi:leader peptidase (prepilin peptidase)/N-methyltransferase